MGKTPLSASLLGLGVPRGQAKSEQHLPGATETQGQPASAVEELAPSPSPAEGKSLPEQVVHPAPKVVRQTARSRSHDETPEAPMPANSSPGRFARKQAAEARSGITIRIRITAADRLDNLAKRTGISKQDLLDQAIQDMLDAADQEGNLTAPLS